MDVKSLGNALHSIYLLMEENKNILCKLDAQNGDGDLGVSMSNGFKAIDEYASNSNEKDFGRLLIECSRVLNETAPSSLGTILSIGIAGMAKALKGKFVCTIAEMVNAMDTGLQNIYIKAKSKPGEKTIIDALYPAVEYLKQNADKEYSSVWDEAAKAALKGSESTKGMKSVHGRASYYGDKSIGMIDAGSVVGYLIFKGISMAAK